jgi:hypothetical protein
VGPEFEDSYEKGFENLLKETRGPLRYKEKMMSGVEVRYFRERTWGEFFFEKLASFVDERAVIKGQARKALDQYVRSHLKAAQGVQLLTTLERRILGKSAWRLNPKSAACKPVEGLESTGLMKVGGLARVPDSSLSLSTVPACDVIADVAIMKMKMEEVCCLPAHISTVYAPPMIKERTSARECIQGEGRDAHAYEQEYLACLNIARDSYLTDFTANPNSFVVDPRSLAGLKNDATPSDEHIGAMLDAIRDFIRLCNVSVLIAVPDLVLYGRIATKMCNQQREIMAERLATPGKDYNEKYMLENLSWSAAKALAAREASRKKSESAATKPISYPGYDVANDDDNPSYM